MKVYDGSQSGQHQEREPNRVTVGIAECEVTTDGGELTTSGLGSCVGVALHDATTGVAGLVHVMLPTADGNAGDEAAKFADTGTELLVEEMGRAGADPDRVEAKIAGGSDMLDFSESGSGIGNRNVRQVRETLADHGIPVVGEDVGGDHGRSLRLEAHTGDLVVRSANAGDRRL